MIEKHSTGSHLGSAALAEPSWEELVSSALLGTERRTPPVTAREGRSTPAALLDAAAVSTVRRRAALRPAPARERPVPAPPDSRPPLPPAARRRLALLLADRNGTGSGHRRGTAPDLTELLPQWLTAAARHGYRAPEALLPALLDAARARTDLRAAALAFAGPRALWLARLNDEWKFALRGIGSAAALPGADEPEAVRALWEEGLFAERVSLLAALRRRDPAAGLALLATTWATERAEDRLMFLDSLREGLSVADEPFLEEALADRSRNVRGTAAELLSALPGTALAARMADRARACITLARTEAHTEAHTEIRTDKNNGKGTEKGTDAPGAEASGGWTLVVDAPRECDAAMQRDGVVPKPPTGRGERAWWLSQLLEAAPLECWSGWLGGREPAEIVALPVADGWHTELHDAWCRAAVRQRDVAWTRALLGTPAAVPQDSGTYATGTYATGAAAPYATGAAAPNSTTAPGGPAGSSRDLARLLTVLPEDARARWVAEFIAAHGLSDAFRMLGVCAVPWSEPLGRAVVDALDIARDAGSYPWSFSGVMGLAERCLDPDAADRLAMLTATPDEPADGSPGAVGYWSEAFQRLVSTLRLRATMRAELAP
ncbi:hypothetical protein A6A06_04785 [Streptomyces sp. CB02923]|uniref:DUF5691 domain-containing protein n=1 Tax=Streptomyces sp. CB02923 TaxID=1718985 RepID=UPI0009393D96|nr:DUF5691 domain-containing protein [Streptomyces sp. CB02923]OKI09942.1 hypothetical protein A6A06_04785 [Streptomyces sp. CB02923]